MAQLPTPMSATRTLSLERALPFFEPLVSAMVSFRLLTRGMPSPSVSAARMTSFALVARARRLGMDLVLQLVAGRGAGGRGSSLLALCGGGRSAGDETPKLSARMPAATSLTLEPRRAVSRTSAPLRGVGIRTRMLGALAIASSQSASTIASLRYSRHAFGRPRPAEDGVASLRAVASRRARGGDRRGAERSRRREARARGGVRGDGLRGERRPRRAVARRRGRTAASGPGCTRTRAAR